MTTDLLNYVKFMSSRPSQEIEYVKGSIVTLVGNSWQSDSDLLVCPLRMFAPLKLDLNCYRDSL
jgi:hypothetical protein